MRHPRDWPVEARVWLYRAGINNDDIEKLGAFWSPSMGRVVIPYRTVAGADVWIARDTSGMRPPKYLFPEGTPRGGGALFEHSYPGAVGIAITEDILSAYRIAKDTDLTAVAAQGTTLDRDAVVQIAAVAAKDAIPVFLWLDPDKYGQMGARIMREKFLRLGVDARNVLSARDPKLHEPHELREALEA